MSKIPTAKELLNRDYISTKENAVNAMIEFAKLHLEAALKAIAKNGKETLDWITEECNSLIENAYPLENIK